MKLEFTPKTIIEEINRSRETVLSNEEIKLCTLKIIIIITYEVIKRR